MKNVRLILATFVASLLLLGCYSKRVEKTVEPRKEVVIDRQPSTNVTIHEDNRDGDDVVYKRKETVTERHY